MRRCAVASHTIGKAAKDSRLTGLQRRNTAAPCKHHDPSGPALLAIKNKPTTNTKHMKKLLFTLTLGLALVASPAAFAQAKKKDAAKPAEAPAAAPAAAGAEKKADKPLPMNATATEIDAAAKTFTHVTAAGKRVKHTVTATTTIMQGEAAAKFEDIKVGDTVAGLRLKKGTDDYEVVKITKFGVKAPKKDGEKAAEKKPADKK
jgi:hypothetical protein